MVCRRPTSCCQKVNDFSTGEQETPAPVSQIGITSGLLEQYDDVGPEAPIRFFVQPGILTAADAESLLTVIRSLTSHARQITDSPLPFGGLNVVYLHDHHWELAPYGPGLVVLTENGGDLESQLLRGISQQWAGSYLISAGTENPDFIVTLQAMLAHEIARNAGISVNELKPSDMISNIFQAVDTSGPPVLEHGC